MDSFVKACGLILVAVIICIILSGHQKIFGMIVVIGVCSMVALTAVEFLEPIIIFLKTLHNQGNWNHDLFEILLKALGIGLLTEIVIHICNDAGYAAMGKTLQILSSAVIIWMSLPLFTSLIELINKVLSNL